MPEFRPMEANNPEAEPRFENLANIYLPMRNSVPEPTTTTRDEFGLLEGYDKKFICGVCQRAYSTLQALQFHQRIECNREPKYKCVYCSYKTVRQTNLRRHMSTHL
ncbi:zinc finger protein 322 isoform X2 [Microplitis demolitor]|uniref:zinc finger protein 322 isoform X2 n=1 Tax=Microplitis demolitor TaxID=69319 RepID=UPI00235B5D77|nr:zinc finger protein 322 isoform X2 [Microplitis demolitor]